MTPPLSEPVAAPELSIIIVSWNVKTLLQACLDSIFSQMPGISLEVIVVDSGSADGTTQMVASAFPQVRLIACRENVGFPKGNNLGIAEANGRYILLLNPDTVIVGAALMRMRDYLDANPHVGAVGPQLLNGDGTVQSSRRRFPTVWTAFFESTWLQPLAPKGMMSRYYMADVPDDETAVVDWVTGACIMTKRAVLAAVGGLDEGYFMYSEELDWCRRVQMNGWQIVYLPTAQIVHYTGKSSEQAVTARHINFQRAKLRYFRKYHGRWVTAVLRLFLLKIYAWQIALEMAKGLLGHKRPLRWQRARSYWQVVRSGLRPAGY